MRYGDHVLLFLVTYSKLAGETDSINHFLNSENEPFWMCVRIALKNSK
jgi:hypothetical protein